MDKGKGMHEEEEKVTTLYMQAPSGLNWRKKPRERKRRKVMERAGDGTGSKREQGRGIGRWIKGRESIRKKKNKGKREQRRGIGRAEEKGKERTLEEKVGDGGTEKRERDVKGKEKEVEEAEIQRTREQKHSSKGMKCEKNVKNEEKRIEGRRKKETGENKIGKKRRSRKKEDGERRAKKEERGGERRKKEKNRELKEENHKKRNKEEVDSVRKIQETYGERKGSTGVKERGKGKAIRVIKGMRRNAKRR
ncbi:uncharacterized protein LOC135129888 [Zophobas morio]|uniref:uncharacterized protein LOC135129888 n=1 Tax=Zophobas morio TaxID=2755281 RepID=UPI0030834A33